MAGHSMEFYNYGGYVGFDTFQSMNDSVFFQSSSDFSLSDDLSMVMGLSYESKDLQKPYELSSYYTSTPNADTFDSDSIPDPINFQKSMRKDFWRKIKVCFIIEV